MNPKAISFRPEVLKAKLRALDEHGRCMTRRPMKPHPVEIDADGGGRIWHLETKDGFINSNGDGTWPLTLTHAVRDQDGRVYPPVAPFAVGQSLWIRERARVLGYDGLGRGRVRLRYEVDGAESDWIEVPERIVTCEPGTCIANGVFREGARHFLEVVDVRAERVAEISEQDALLEGVAPVVHEHWTAYDPETDGYPSFGVEPDAEMISIRRLESVRHHGPNVIATAGSRFHTLYDSIYGAGAHAKDWCWVYTLTRAAP